MKQSTVRLLLFVVLFGVGAPAPAEDSAEAAKPSLTVWRSEQERSAVESVGSNIFRTIPISEWVGERFVFLPQQSMFHKYGYQLIFKTDQTIGSLPYREYVGRIVKVTSVSRSSAVSGSWHVELTMEDSGEKLKALAVLNRIKGLGPVADLENARAHYKGKTLWLQNSTIQALRAADDEIAILGVDASKPITVVDVVSSWNDEAPVRFIIQTADGTKGFRDVSMSGTNVSESLRRYHRFDFEFSATATPDDRTSFPSRYPLPPQASATSKPSDVLGWQDARWGMTEEDIVRTFGSAVQRLPQKELFRNAYVDQIIPNFTVNGEVYTVRFQMDPRTKRLIQIMIRLDQMESSSSRADAFFGLEELLKQKYGAPAYKKEETQHVISLERRWIFPTTTILLHYSFIRSISASTLTISYVPSNTGDVNKL